MVFRGKNIDHSSKNVEYYRERRKEKNIKELGDLFKAISLIVGIAIAIYHRRRKKRF
ncbi:MAG: hypothetical protein J6X12_01225 [Paludibacteraceae bacterium]|nr:hypothetical protein [Paludibacteraceae bacterium]